MLAAVLSAVPAAPASSGASSSSAGSRPSSSVQHAGRAAVPSWSALLVGCDVFGLVASWLCGVQPDDVLLEAVALAGALAGHEQLAAQLADSGAVRRTRGAGLGQGTRQLQIGRARGARMSVAAAALEAASFSRLMCPALASMQLLSLADVMASKCQDDEFVLQVRCRARVACGPLWCTALAPDELCERCGAPAFHPAVHDQLCHTLLLDSNLQHPDTQTAWAFARALAVQPTRDLVLAETQVRATRARRDDLRVAAALRAEQGLHARATAEPLSVVTGWGQHASPRCAPHCTPCAVPTLDTPP